jgi:hypothetical protein
MSMQSLSVKPRCLFTASPHRPTATPPRPSALRGAAPGTQTGFGPASAAESDVVVFRPRASAARAAAAERARGAAARGLQRRAGGDGRADPRGRRRLRLARLARPQQPQRARRQQPFEHPALLGGRDLFVRKIKEAPVALAALVHPPPRTAERPRRLLRIELWQRPNLVAAAA